MSCVIRFIHLFFFGVLTLSISGSLHGQGDFSDQVDRALGSNQELVNGIQFSNQYIRTEGQPYWINGGFKTGSMCINDHWFDQVQLRYNLFSQKLELGYLTPEGFMNQIITVPENISAFVMEGYLFRRLLIGNEAASYYQVVSWGSTSCYIRWSKEMLGSRSTETSFSNIKRKYWMKREDQWISFKNQRTFLLAFPRELKSDLKKLLKHQNYNFQDASAEEMLEMLKASLWLLEERGSS